LLILAIIPTVAAVNISASVGETWITYRWESGQNVNIYVDGVKVINNTPFRDWYLTDINSDEKHQIKVFNASNPTEELGSLTVTTLHSQGIIITLICILIGFFIILLFINDPIKTILVGGLSASISLYTSQIALGYGALTIIPLVTLVLSAIFIVKALWEIIIEKTQW
jgi:hypothetical protein